VERGLRVIVNNAKEGMVNRNVKAPKHKENQ
jgi:hypothetical protein